MNAQIELAFRAEAPEVTDREVENLIARLRGRGWRTSTELGADTEGKKRALRAIANASEGQIISGQKGYTLTLEATLEEITHSVKWLRSQARQMIGRTLDIQRVRHGQPKRRRP